MNRGNYGSGGPRPFKSNFTPGNKSNSHSLEKRTKRGPTIYIHASNLTESVLQSAFKTFGNIVNIKIASGTTAFLTYEKVESAEVAITEVSKNFLAIYNY